MKKTIITAIAAIATIMLVSGQNAHAFGFTGHRTVADIAEQHLSAKTKIRVEKIIGKVPLARLATWPDEIKSDKAWKNCSSVWHYLSIDDNETFEGLDRDPDGDVLGALENFEKVLKGEVGSKTYQCKAADSAKESIEWQALAFYVHFAGDIHQPLHVGRRDDQGGNKIIVKWFDDNSNIHSVWDSKMLGLLGLSYTEYSRFLPRPDKNQIGQWQSADYLDWAKESKALRSQVYDFGLQGNSLPELSYEYNYKNKDLLNRRVLKAGIRLAGKLNRIFGD